MLKALESKHNGMRTFPLKAIDNRAMTLFSLIEV